MGDGFPFDDLKNWRAKEPKKSSGRRGVKAVDSSVFYCPECLKCWEKLPYVHGRARNNKIQHYKDFPSINKERRVCYECTEKNKDSV